MIPFNYGYVPDFRKKSFIKDSYMRLFGYPYPPRKNEIRKIIQYLELKKKDKILDIGCGDGVWYLELLKQGFDITGIDVSDKDLEKLKHRAKIMGLSTKVKNEDAQKMSFENNYFDKILSACTIEHIPDDDAVFKKAYQILKNKGRFVISIPLNVNSLYTKIIIRLPRFIKRIFFVKGVVNSVTGKDFIDFHSRKYSHFHNYNEKEIIARLKRIGFKIRKVDYNCKFFGSTIYSMYHSLKIFERNKSSETDYKFKNEFLFALVSPIFYLFFLLDDLLFLKKGQIIVISMEK